MAASRLLETAPLRRVGQLSYGIYIWEILFVSPVFGHVWLLLLAGTVLLSHLAFEQPLRKLGRKLAQRLEPAHSVALAQ
jgi:peptidoglycan/LPS O-acetylase OafA/YrhL